MGIPALVEGHLETVFLPVVLRQIGRGDLQPTIRDARGGSGFWKAAVRYNQAGRHGVVIGLADLEKAECASSLFVAHLRRKNPGFHLRIAVRMLESWLMADRAAMADFLRIPISSIPIEPDSEGHPKRKLVDLVRKSTSKTIRDAMLPQDSGGTVGPEYVPTMTEFISGRWRAEQARILSPSLERACQRWAAIELASAFGASESPQSGVQVL